MKIEIKNRWTGELIFGGEFASLKLAVEHCVTAKISLSAANLRDANLSDADLRDANLSDANLRDANLSDANLSDADLRDANLRDANLRDANLSDANLSAANLSAANLSAANLSAANLSAAPFAVPHLDAKILATIKAAEPKGGGLYMGDWHKCETTHCRAGWAVVVSGEVGKALEFLYGTQGAANLIYAASRPNKKQPNFFATNEEAMSDIEASAAGDPLPV